MAVARCEPSTLDEGDLAFRLAPRINASGRLYRADAGVELFLTDDPQRAGAIAAELDRANQERRAYREGGGGGGELRALPAPRTAARGGGDRRRGPRLASRRDRDSRLAPGRAPPEAGDPDLDRRRGGRPGLGAQHPRLRPPGGAAGVLGAPGALRRPPGGGGPRDRRGPPRGVPRGLPGPRDRGHRAGGAGSHRAHRRRGRRQPDRARPRRGARAAGPVRRGQPRRQPAGALGPDPGRARDGRRQALPLQPPQRRQPGAHRGLRASLDPGGRGRGRSTRRCGSRSTSGTARSSPASSCARCTGWAGRRPRPGAGRASLRDRRAEWWERFDAETAGGPAAAEPSAPPGGARARAGAAHAARPRRSSPSWSPAAIRCWCSRPTRRGAPASPPVPRAWPGSGPGRPRIACGRCPREAIEALRHPRPGGLALADYAGARAGARPPRRLRARGPRRPAGLRRADGARRGPWRRPRATCTRSGGSPRSPSPSRCSRSSTGCGWRSARCSSI